MQTVISIDKIIAATFSWVNQHNNLSLHRKPKAPTANGSFIPSGYAAYHADFPCETMLERARRLDIIDRWKPNLYLRLQGGVRMTIQGPQALSLWEAYKAREFNKSHKAQHNESTRNKDKATKD
jgi:hypothetical protein